MTYFGAFPHNKLYLHARIAEFVFRFPPPAVFLNPKVFIKNIAMVWWSHAHIWSIAYLAVLLIGIINGGWLRYINIQCSGINPFSVHFVKPCKKVVTVAGIPEQRLMFAVSFWPNWTCGTSDCRVETRTKCWYLHLVSFRGNTTCSGCWQPALLSSNTYPPLDGS